MDNWTEYMSTSENLEQVPVTIKYGSNRKSTNLDLPQMQYGNFFLVTLTTAIKKNWVGRPTANKPIIVIIIIKSPKQSLGDLLFLLRFLLLLFLFFFFSFLSADHELVHGRSQELLDRIL
jgi:hypothetical protein